jgi:hypothetical protein
MSNPSLLEYHLLSSCPFGGLLPKRLPISGYVPVCPTVRGLLQKLFNFRQSFECLHCFTSYRGSLPLNSQLKVCLNRFTMLEEFHPGKYIVSEVVLEGRGFKPRFVGKIYERGNYFYSTMVLCIFT